MASCHPLRMSRMSRMSRRGYRPGRGGRTPQRCRGLTEPDRDSGRAVAAAAPSATPTRRRWGHCAPGGCPRILTAERVYARRARRLVGAASVSTSGDADESVQVRVDETRALVEGSMMAAVGGLMYFGSLLLRLDAHIASLYPLPIVIMSLRWDSGAAARCMIVTTLLLCTVAGPLRGLIYLSMHGCLGLVLGRCWKSAVPWFASIAVCAAVRCLGYCVTILLTSLLLRENLMSLLASNMAALLENVASMVSTAEVPVGAVAVTAFVLITLNSVIYCTLLHALYAIILRLMGRKEGNVPARIMKLMKLR